MENDFDIGAKLRTLRTVANYDQKAVATHLGIQPLAYGKIERNESEVTITTLKKIATLYKISLMELLNVPNQLSIRDLVNCSNFNILNGTIVNNYGVDGKDEKKAK